MDLVQDKSNILPLTRKNAVDVILTIFNSVPINVNLCFS